MAGLFCKRLDRWLSNKDHLFDSAEFATGNDLVNVYTGGHIAGIKSHRVFSGGHLFINQGGDQFPKHIVHSDLDENATNDVVDRVKGWITEAGGIIDKVDPWGKRKLAYPIRKQTEGQYFFLKAQMPPSFIADLERNLRFVEPVMRFLITAVE